jgi:hypothetical protein
MWKKILIGLAAVIAVVVLGFLGLVAMQPAEFSISRSATMNAPPEEVFAQVNNFHNWQGWSPWAELDPDAKYVFEGPSSGEGAIFRWAGNEKVGEGDMTITASKPAEEIRLTLHFVKPFEDTANTVFTFAPADDGTKVTWTMSGRNNFIGRACCLLMDMDAMVGGDFEKGLANIQKVVEAAPSEEKPADEETKPHDAGA